MNERGAGCCWMPGATWGCRVRGSGCHTSRLPSTSHTRHPASRTLHAACAILNAGLGTLHSTASRSVHSTRHPTPRNQHLPALVVLLYCAACALAAQESPIIRGASSDLVVLSAT